MLLYQQQSHLHVPARQGPAVPVELTVGRTLLLAAERDPDALAVVCGDESLTHAGVNAFGNRIANALLDLGLRKGDRFGVMLPNSVLYTAICYAAAKSGLVMVLLNSRFSARDLHYHLEDAGVRALFFADSMFERVDGARALLADAQLHCIDVDGERPRCHALSQLLNGMPDHEPDAQLGELDVFYLGYTSGTTGKPKGALITHRNRSLAYHYWALEYGFGRGDVYLQSGPSHHSVQFGFTLAQLSLGGSSIVMPRFDAVHALRLMRQHGVHWTLMVPYMYQELVAMPPGPAAELHPDRLRTFISAASALPTAVKNALLERYPAVALHEFYGATEAGVVTSLRPEEQRLKTRCVGRPVQDMEVRVLREDGSLAPAGEVGALYLRGPTMFDGYFRSTEKTAQAFRDDWCTLGDLGRMDDEGYVYIVDRAKDVIKSGGVNIFPAEIEEVLALHPAVSEVAVIGVPHPRWQEAVHAVVVPRAGHSPTPAELTAFCRAELADYKVPKSVEFRAELPRSPAGKVLKRELREPWWQDQPLRV
jgi:long-chain acyl-CoA synthetase